MITRTRWQTLLAIAAASGLVSYVATRWWVNQGHQPPPVSPSIAVVLLILAGILFILGRTVRGFTQGKRPQMDPLHAFRILVLAKASALAGAIQLGFFAAQVVIAFDHIEAPDPRALAWSSGVAALSCVVLIVVSLVVEWLCRVPPVDDGQGHGGKPA